MAIMWPNADNFEKNDRPRRLGATVSFNFQLLGPYNLETEVRCLIRF